MAADTFACISQYVALATGDCDVLADGVVVGRIMKVIAIIGRCPVGVGWSGLTPPPGRQ